MTKSAKCKLLELPDPLPGEVELVTDLLEGAWHAVVEAITKSEDATLSIWKAFDRHTQGVGNVQLLGHLDWVGSVLVLDEITELSAVLTDRLL